MKINGEMQFGLYINKLGCERIRDLLFILGFVLVRNYPNVRRN
jgi:hypothetical protein